MNEEQLAQLLDEHLAALLEGRPLPDASPDLAPLLAVATNLVEVTPLPSPEFGPALKASLLAGPAGGSGPTGLAGGTAAGSKMALWVGGVVLALAVLIGTAVWMANRPAETAVTPSAVPATAPGQAQPSASTPERVEPTAAPAEIEQATVTPPVVTPATVIPQATPTVLTSTPTVIVDVLPPITVTVETGEVIPAAPDLVPGGVAGGGHAGSGDDGSGGGAGGSEGDANRGHGNDADHHDEDNPGKGGNK